ncbi:tetratricopeptide repeat protein [Mangrovibacterium diazotrophicum]|uniref:Tetratricopeptide repeat protein n=1 Tax=Mangrovibacterium diazotrophicum TaxID=1261403 RepID=A0A419VWB6_9BACT|nr:tetratricopeptide repeat protein [Mangrovibacterium diazotrophicum]RKD86366.1 tetratricopeptide repeat protein [Mangrovibacterium diazotrophicum]
MRFHFVIRQSLLILFVLGSIAAFSQSTGNTAMGNEKQSGFVHMNELIKLYEQNRNSYPYKAIDYIKEAISIAELSGTDEIRCSVYNKLGNVYSDLGLNFLAMDAFYSSLKYAEGLDDPYAVPFCFIDIGNVYYTIDNNERSLEYYQKAIELLKSNNIKDGLAIPYNNIGLIKIKQHDYVSALKEFELSYTIRQEHGATSDMAHSNMLMSEAYLGLEQYNDAIAHLETAKALYEKAGDPKNQMITVSKMGEVYESEKDYPKAILLYQQALDYFETTNDYMWIVIENRNLAKVYQKTEQYNKAISHAEAALQSSRANHYSQYLVEILKILADTHYKNKQEDDAYYYHDMLINVSDSLQQVNDNLQFANLQFSVETLKHNIEKEQLENEINKRKAVRNYIILIFIFISLIFLSVLFRFLKKRKQERNRFLQKEKIAAVKLQEKEVENDELNKELEQRNKELTSKTMGIVKNAEFINSVIEELDDLVVNRETKAKIRSIIDKLSHNQKEDSWEEFEIRFTNVHQDFIEKLNQKHPDLSPNERRLCAFLRLNMTTKEISSITYQNSKSIDVARYRLRKKMQLSRETNLISYLSSF